MPAFVHEIAKTLEAIVGWIFSPSWLPPKDFEFFKWLIVPGFGYGLRRSDITMPAQFREITAIK